MASASTSWSMQAVSQELYTQFNCFPVFLGRELKEEYYKGLPSTAGPCSGIKSRHTVTPDCQCRLSRASCRSVCSCRPCGAEALGRPGEDLAVDRNAEVRLVRRCVLVPLQAE